jgi:ribosomal protein S16
MLTIKLAKIGKKNKKLFRVVICEKTQDPYGKALEILGSYNPYNKELVIKADRVKYWISKGSSMTPSVNNLLIEKKIIEGKKAVNSKPGTPNKRKAEKIEKAKQKEVVKETKEEVETPIEAPAEAQVEATENIEKTE